MPTTTVRGKGDAVALEQPGRGRGPGEAFPAFAAHFGQGGGQVQREFVRFGVLAGVVTAPAVVAEVGKLGDVAVEAKLRSRNIAGKTEQ